VDRLEKVQLVLAYGKASGVGGSRLIPAHCIRDGGLLVRQ
jgi:hypothetical protein